MEYTIGQVAQKTGLTTHTLRYYDKENLLPKIRKNSAGIRRYTDEDLNHLAILECLKATGLQLKDIKHYFDLCLQGEKSLQERRELFCRQKARLEQQMQELQQNMERINFKIRYYDEAFKGGEKGIYERNKQLLEDKKKLFKIA